jgi:hypothetical protein
MSIVALDAPDFRTISEFRRHLKALGALYKQILHLCETANRLGRPRNPAQFAKLMIDRAPHSKGSTTRGLPVRAPARGIRQAEILASSSCGSRST